MKIEQAMWAMTHDWARRIVPDERDPHDYTVVVEEIGTQLVQGVYVPYSEIMAFTSIKALRHWAGY